MKKMRRLVQKQSVALVVIKPQHLIRKIRDDDAGLSGPVVVSCVYAHSRTRDSILTIRYARLHTFLRKRPIAIIYVKFIRLRVIAEQNVRPAILIRIYDGYTEA